MPVELFAKILEIDKKTLQKGVTALEKLSLIDVGTDTNGKKGLKIHRLLQEEVSRYSKTHHHTESMTSPQIIYSLAEGMAMTYFSRDSTSLQAAERNRNYLPHVEKILNYVRENNLKLTPELVFLEISRAVYYDFGIEHKRARELLHDIKRRFEQECGIDSVKDTSEIICRKLLAKSSHYPTLYAQILYHLGRANLALRNSESPETNASAGKYFEQATKLRRIIDAPQSSFSFTRKKYDDSLNEQELDSRIFERSGLLLWHRFQKTPQHLAIALEGYRKLVQQVVEEGSIAKERLHYYMCQRHVIETLMDILELQQAKAQKVDGSVDLDTKDKAIEIVNELAIYFNLDKALARDRKEFSDQILKELEARSDETRIAREYNLVAKVFQMTGIHNKSIEDLEIAAKFYNKAIEIETSNNRKNFMVDDAVKGLEEIKKVRTTFAPSSLLLTWVAREGVRKAADQPREIK